MLIVLSLNSNRHLVGQELLPQRLVLRSKDLGFWHIFRTCHHNDTKYFTSGSIRNCNFTILFLHNSCLDNLSYFFRLDGKRYGMSFNASTLWTPYHCFRRIWILRITYFLVSWRKSLQRIHGGQRLIACNFLFDGVITNFLALDVLLLGHNGVTEWFICK